MLVVMNNHPVWSCTWPCYGYVNTFPGHMILPGLKMTSLFNLGDAVLSERVCELNHVDVCFPCDIRSLRMKSKEPQ